MKTLKKVSVTPVYVEFMPDFDKMDEATIYISEKYGSSTHKCLCGCGEKTVLPLNKDYGWVLIKENNGTVSFTPSIGNYQMDCKSHYIITNSVANFV